MIFPDPGWRIRFFPTRIPDPGLTTSRIPDPHPNPKNCYYVLKNKIRNVHPDPGSWIWILFDPGPGSRGEKAPNPGSTTLSNTV